MNYMMMKKYLKFQLKAMNSLRRHIHFSGYQKDAAAEIWVNKGYAQQFANKCRSTLYEQDILDK